MKENQNLAGFDMVLGLSQNTINFQFQQLHRRKIIKNKWAVMVGNVLNPPKGEKAFRFEGSEAELKSKLTLWISRQREIASARNAGNWAEIGKLIDLIKAENANFDYVWDAQLAPPTIEIIDKDTQHVFMLLKFSGGTLYYRPDETSEIKSFDLKGCIYAFTSPIGRLKINKDQMLMDADEEMNLILRQGGLSESDFRIESLFLNIENANISTFNKSRSIFPDSATLPLQIAIESYFNQVMRGSENPYVLGYGVTRPKINNEKALFQPTSLEYSTSFSSKLDSKQPVKGQFSALNFLMMLNGNEPVKNQKTGIIPASLIELGKDMTSTTDGVFVIDGDHFNAYLYALDEYVASTFSDKTGVEIEGGGFQNEGNERVLHANYDTKHIDDEINTVYKLVRKPVENVENGIKVTYTFEINMTVHVHIGAIDIYQVSLSTSGQYTHGEIDKIGAIGQLQFIIKNGKLGRFDLENELKSPIIAFDKSPLIVGGGFLDIIGDILSFIFLWPLKIAQGIANQIAIDLGRDNVKVQNSKINSLREIDVLNQTNKVILPLGKTYAYKNLRCLKDKSLVAYDISYAPVVE